jgi:hypothetical protein
MKQYRPYREPYASDKSDSKWDSTVGQDGQSKIIHGGRNQVALSHPFQVRVAKTIHLSGKMATSVQGRFRTFAPVKFAHQPRHEVLGKEG